MGVKSNRNNQLRNVFRFIFWLVCKVSCSLFFSLQAQSHKRLRTMNYVRSVAIGLQWHPRKIFSETCTQLFLLCQASLSNTIQYLGTEDDPMTDVAFAMCSVSSGNVCRQVFWLLFFHHSLPSRTLGKKYRYFSAATVVSVKLFLMSWFVEK